MAQFSDAVQAILTQGLDVAGKVALAKYGVHDPATMVVGPDGRIVRGGTQAPATYAPAGVPAWVWVAGAIALGVVVVPRLLRR